MLDITLSNFERDVIEASRQQPVLLDIWAPWCGPCRSLSPVLERLEAAYTGRFALAKLNSDDQPEIAGQLSRMFGVRSIPFCVLFQQGQPVDGFVGALPESELRTFLDKHVPSAGAFAAHDDADLARELLSSGRVDDGIASLRHALEADPSNDAARFTCLSALIQAGRLGEARDVYAPVAGRGTPATDDLAAAGVWLEACESVSAGDRTPDDPAAHTSPEREVALEARFRTAQCHLARAAFPAALDELLEILMRDKDWANGRARMTYLAILRLMRAAEASAEAASDGATSAHDMLPTDTPSRARSSAADTYHRRLSMILF